MASVSTSHLILFFASMLIAASVAGTFMTGVDRLSGALGDRSIDVSNDVRTDIEIISDPGSGAVYNASTTNVTVLVKNTGSMRLHGTPSQIEVLVDGKYQSDFEVTVLDGTTWDRGNVVRLEIDEPLNSGDHRVKVSVNGNAEILEFNT